MGVVDNSRNQRGTAPTCPTCKGKSFVYPEKICCCGGAAVTYVTALKTWYCGDERCMSALKVKRVN